jgi:hypothetical protein
MALTERDFINPALLVTASEDGRVLTAPRPLPRRMPIKTKTVDVGGDYAGWTATIRTNAPFSTFISMARLADGDGQAPIRALAELYDILPRVVIAWNFVDEEGEPLPCDREGFAHLPAELIMALVNAVNEPAAGADDPKG